MLTFHLLFLFIFLLFCLMFSVVSLSLHIFSQIVAKNIPPKEGHCKGTEARDFSPLVCHELTPNRCQSCILWGVGGLWYSVINGSLVWLSILPLKPEWQYQYLKYQILPNIPFYLCLLAMDTTLIYCEQENKHSPH
jgi:hypothetical protein